MERVVYILGAGFSAPLGVPVMSEFRLRSQDLFFERPDEFSHFKSVLSEIEKLSVVKNFFTSDLYNIEEILSILDMRAQLTGKTKLRNDFSKYICDTVEATTEPCVVPTGPRRWSESDPFESADIESHYYKFMSAIFRIQYIDSRNTSGKPKLQATPQLDLREFRTDFISMNYDVILENALVFLNRLFSFRELLSLNRQNGTQEEIDSEYPWLLKLHGCVRDKKIIPPTWNKTLNRDISSQWEKAHELLEQAHHIRILGYSLPESDAYVRYLLKSGLVKNVHLKSIEVACLDESGEVQRRYEDLIQFRYFRFRNEDTLSYLTRAANNPTAQNPAGGIYFRLKP